MIKSAITVSLVPEARGGPFVFWGDLPGSCRKIAAFGFDAVEIFLPSADAIGEAAVRPILEQNKLKLAAVGTGGGWVTQQLTLTSHDQTVRTRAKEFVRAIIDAAGKFGAPAIVGSLQGRWAAQVDCDTAIHYLRDALEELGEHARKYNVPLLYEPLNRYETNVINTQGEAAALLRSLETTNVKLLCDLYHMNIEETDLGGAIRAAGEKVGHVHFADSNRRPIGNGHTDVSAIVRALSDIGYVGYVSAECLPRPDSETAAQMTIRSFRRFFRH
jgi:sugar phosphate isomerase/epimerase